MGRDKTIASSIAQFRWVLALWKFHFFYHRVVAFRLRGFGCLKVCKYSLNAVRVSWERRRERNLENFSHADEFEKLNIMVCHWCCCKEVNYSSWEDDFSCSFIYLCFPPCNSPQTTSTLLPLLLAFDKLQKDTFHGQKFVSFFAHFATIFRTLWIWSKRRIKCEWCVPCLKIHLPNFFVAKFASSFSLLFFNPQLNFFSSPLSLLHSLPLFLRHKFCVLAFRHLNSLLALRNIAFLLMSIETTFWLFYATTKKKMKECTWQHLAMIKCRDNRCLLIGLSSYLFSLCFLLDELACSCKSF